MSQRLHDVSLRLGTETAIRLCGLITMPLLARTMGADGYGLIIGVGSVVGFFATWGSLGLSYHIGRIVGRGETLSSRRLLRSLLLIAIGSGLACAAVMTLAAPLLNDWFLRHSDGRMAIMLASGCLIAACLDGILLEWLRLRERYRSLSLIQAGAALVQVAVLAGVVWAGHGPVTALGCMSVVQLGRVAMMALLVRSTARAVDTPHGGAPPDLRTCVRDGLTIALGGLGSWGLSQGGRLALAHAPAIGNYGAAAALASAPGIVGSACGLPLYPALVRAVAANDTVAAAAAVRHYASIYQTLALPAVAISMVLCGNAIHLLAGREFAGLGPVCAVLLVASWLEMTLLPLSYALAAHGWASRTRNAQLAAAVVSLATAIICAPFFGALGVSAAGLAGQLAMLGLLAWGLRHAGFTWCSLIPQRLLRIVASTGTAALVALSVPSATWLGLVMSGSAALCAATVILMFPFPRPRDTT